MSTAIRKTINLKNEKKENISVTNNNDIPRDFFKKLKLLLDSNITCTTVYPSYKDKKINTS